MTFSSVSPLSSLRLTQSISLHSQLIERWQFTFGFVIPGSTNSWQCTIEKAKADGDQQQQLTPELLSGNVLIETTFWDGEDCLGKQKLRIYYDGNE
jgi:retinal rod rhodopsin-sensitive cGMP 3',5'-cyclic phosphodiesterase subunit delta